MVSVIFTKYYDILVRSRIFMVYESLFSVGGDLSPRSMVDFD